MIFFWRKIHTNNWQLHTGFLLRPLSFYIFLHIQLFQTLGFLFSFLFFLFLWCFSPLKTSKIKFFNFRVFMALLRRWQTSAAVETTTFSEICGQETRIYRSHLSAQNLWLGLEGTLFCPKNRPWTENKSEPATCTFSALSQQFLWVCLKLLSRLSSLSLSPFWPVPDLFCSSKWEPSPLGLQYPPLLVEEF